LVLDGFDWEDVMGYETNFYGKLKFTRRLDDAELATFEQFLKGHDTGFRADFSIAPQKDGLVYTSEKTYDLVSEVNFIIENSQRLIPGFGLKGSLFADTEFEPHYWLLKIGPDGDAFQEPCKIDDLWSHSKREYLGRQCFKLKWKIEKPIVMAARRHRKAFHSGDDGSRGSFRTVVDAACFEIEDMKARCSIALWNRRHPNLKV
jgi:hypothetical protein